MDSVKVKNIVLSIEIIPFQVVPILNIMNSNSKG